MDAPPLPANPALPTLWLIGDSAVRTGTGGDNVPTGQRGWGAPIRAFFDPSKINVFNRAFGGTSSRTFCNGFFWDDLKPRIRKGNIVLIQFAVNDNSGARGKVGLGGIWDEPRMNGDEIERRLRDLNTESDQIYRASCNAHQASHTNFQQKSLRILEKSFGTPYAIENCNSGPPVTHQYHEHQIHCYPHRRFRHGLSLHRL